ncbi:cyclic nucleotide-binding domain-containing protein [Bacteriovoracaceae bacterium]|nr:cyclic nucleotide-binding domain-containing protein [Bacteriovoracaceae bacterium]
MAEIELSFGGGNNNNNVVKKGEFLFIQGEKVSSFFLVKRGEICLFKTNEKKIIPVGYEKSKGIVGADCVLTSDEYFYTALAMEDSSVVEINRNEIMQYLAYKDDWVRKLLIDLSGKIDHTMNIVSEHKLVDPSLFGDQDFNQEIERQIRILLEE